MKKVVLVSIVCFLLSVPNLAISGETWTGNINLFLGAKTLDEYDWEPLEEQGEFGIKVDFKRQNWPLSIAIEYLYSRDYETMLIYDPFLGYLSDSDT